MEHNDDYMNIIWILYEFSNQF